MQRMIIGFRKVPQGIEERLGDVGYSVTERITTGKFGLVRECVVMDWKGLGGDKIRALYYHVSSDMEALLHNLGEDVRSILLEQTKSENPVVLKKLRASHGYLRIFYPDLIVASQA